MRRDSKFSYPAWASLNTIWLLEFVFEHLVFWVLFPFASISFSVYYILHHFTSTRFTFHPWQAPDAEAKGAQSVAAARRRPLHRRILAELAKSSVEEVRQRLEAELLEHDQRIAAAKVCVWNAVGKV